MTKRLLVAYSVTATHVQTTLDYLDAFKKYSGFDVTYLHVTNGAEIDADLNQFDAVVHSYCARLCYDGLVSPAFVERLSAYRGTKLMAVQDEYDLTDKLKSAISACGFDIVLTCVPQDAIETIYPARDFPATRFETVFTGYIPDNYAAAARAVLPLGERPIHVGYRGRDIGGRYGRLGFDKFEIGRRMKLECAARGVPCDIAMDDASRIYGPAWLEFVGDCRVMLGSESGSNVFDFDGALHRRYLAMTEDNGGVRPSYADFLPIVAPHESLVEMGQISPRVFECALMRTPMVLYRGRYSDAIIAGEHYVSLEKDFSNADEVFAAIGDIAALEAMVERTYDHLVVSERFGYRQFVERVERLLREAMSGKTHAASARPVILATDFIANGLTEHPLPGAVFTLREELRLGDIYASEADRVGQALEDLASAAVVTLAGLASSYGASRRRYVDGSVIRSEAIASRELPEPDDFSTLPAEIAADRAAHLARRGALDQAWKNLSEPAVMLEAASERRAFEEAAYRRYCDRVARVQADYAQTVELWSLRSEKLAGATVFKRGTPPGIRLAAARQLAVLQIKRAGRRTVKVSIATTPSKLAQAFSRAMPPSVRQFIRTPRKR